MKIVFLNRSLDRGGAERQLVALAKGLHDKGHTVKVMIFYSLGGFERELIDYGVSVIDLKKQSRWDIVPFVLRVLRTLKHERPDVLHSYLTVSNIFAGLAKITGVVSRVVWGVRASDMDLNNYDWTARVTYKIECVMSKFADMVISNSHAGKKYAIKHGFPESKIEVVPNGIDTARFLCDQETRCRIRESFGIPDNKKVIGMVSRLDPMKGYEVFLHAAALLVEEYNDVVFAGVGHGAPEYEDYLKRLAADLGLEDKMMWLGADLDSAEIYCAYDIMTSASLYGEGFSNVVGEAMSCGVPCVVTDVGDSARIVDEFGIVVKPGGVQDLLGAWVKCLNGREEYASGSLRKRIEEHYSVKTMVEKSEDCLTRVLGN